MTYSAANTDEPLTDLSDVELVVRLLCAAPAHIICVQLWAGFGLG